MKKLLGSTALKAIALLLTIVLGTEALCGGLCLIYMAYEGYYDAAVTCLWDTSRFQTYLDSLMGQAAWYYLDADDGYLLFDRDYTNVLYTIEDPDGNVVYNNYNVHSWEPDSYSYTTSAKYAVPGKYDMTDIEVDYEYVTVTAYVRSPLQAMDYDHLYFMANLFDPLFPIRYLLTWLTVAAALLTVLCLVYLLCAVGHRKGQDEIVLNRLDRIPLEFAAAVCLGLLFLALSWLNAEVFYGNFIYYGDLIFAFAYYGVAILVAITALVPFLLTVVNRLKAHRFLDAMLVVRIGRALGSGTKKLYLSNREKAAARQPEAAQSDELAAVQKAGRGLLHLLRAVGRLLVAGWRTLCNLISRFVHWFVELLRGLPGAWGLLVPAAAVLLLNIFLTRAYMWTRDGYLMFILFVLDAAALLFIWRLGLNFTQLLDACRRLAAGDMATKTGTGKMRWKFKTAAEALNTVGDGMAVAVEARMKSERMKTELITNVSHDIKTPLTSIVNYVDLLGKEPMQTEAAKEYLAVLGRQAQRFKKLTEDLVEASKASTGNLQVQLEPVDLCEFLHQAEAEYQEQLEQADLTPVVQAPEGRLHVLADGKHLWRIMDNLLGNACKYSQPGTRVYLTLTSDSNEAVIQVKNISREPLNISSDELMERFVRGDSARSTDGSGLGLSIARSLAEIQGARFDLAIDGDLFKAEITLERLKTEQ